MLKKTVRQTCFQLFVEESVEPHTAGNVNGIVVGVVSHVSPNSTKLIKAEKGCEGEAGKTKGGITLTMNGGMKCPVCCAFRKDVMILFKGPSIYRPF